MQFVLSCTESAWHACWQSSAAKHVDTDFCSAFASLAEFAAQQDFKSATTGVAAKAMRNEINALVSGIEDPAVRKAFDAEMSNFFTLFNRYLSEKAKGEKL